MLMRVALISFILAGCLSPAGASASTPSSPSALTAAWIARAEAYANAGGATTVGQVAARTGLSEVQVVSSAPRIQSALKGSGINMGSVGSAASGLVGGAIVGLVGSMGVDAFARWALGEQTMLKANGEVFPHAQGSLAHWRSWADGEPVYSYVSGGVLNPEHWDEPLSWMFAGWETPDGTISYSFPAVVPAGVEYLRVASDPFFAVQATARVANPGTVNLSVGGVTRWSPWTEDMERIVMFAKQTYGRTDAPIVPLLGSSNPNGYRYEGFINRRTGEVSPVGWVWATVNGGQVTHLSQGSESQGQTSAAAISGWIDDQIALNEPYVTEIANTQTTPPMTTGVLVPTNLPNLYRYSDDLSELTSSSSLRDVLDVTTVPNVVPPAVREAVPWLNGPDVDEALDVGVYDPQVDDEQRAVAFLSNFWANASTFVTNIVRLSPDVALEQITPEVVRLRGEASNRWPFAGGTIINEIVDRVDQDTYYDPMEWYLDVTPDGSGTTEIGGVPVGHVGVWIRPLQWLQPFKNSEFRWVALAGIWFGAAWALFALLRPRVNV